MTLSTPSAIAAIGYCFGGTTVIELARSGANIAGDRQFFMADWIRPAPADGKNIKGKVLVLAGADDPFQKPEDLTAFETEIARFKCGTGRLFSTARGSRFHATPIPGFVNAGAKYNEKADKRSWQAMKDFFAEIFK